MLKNPVQFTSSFFAADGRASAVRKSGSARNEEFSGGYFEESSLKAWAMHNYTFSFADAAGHVVVCMIIPIAK